jgi:hypothetical protein
MNTYQIELENPTDHDRLEKEMQAVQTQVTPIIKSKLAVRAAMWTLKKFNLAQDIELVWLFTWKNEKHATLTCGLNPPIDALPLKELNKFINSFGKTIKQWAEREAIPLKIYQLNEKQEKVKLL